MMRAETKYPKKRQIVFLQKLDFYSPNKEKILKSRVGLWKSKRRTKENEL